MRRPIFDVVFGVCCLLGASIASAQDAAPPTPTPTTPPTPAPTRSRDAINLPSAKAEVDRQRAMDSTFMTRVELRGLEEVELARIAAQRASNADVRALAQQMVEDRGKTNEALWRLAQSQSIDLPATLDAARRAEVNRISRLSSPELDRAYVLAMVATHDADVADFRKQTGMGQEVELQAWVYDTLPLLEDQQEEIHRIAGELGIAVRPGP